MSRVTGIAATLSTFLLSTASVFAQDGPSTLRLSGGVVHSESMDPVPADERPGNTYKPPAARMPAPRPPARPAQAPRQTLKQPGKKLPVETRFAVPAWLAGVWLRMEAREISRTELPSGKRLKPVGNQIARVRDAFGTYRDSNGQAWQVFDKSHSLGQVDRGQLLDVHHVHSYELVTGGPKTAIVKVKATHTVVNKANRKILSVYQDEELNTYSPTADGRLLTDSSVKVFDLNGKPFLQTRTVSTQTRSAPRNWPPPIRGAQTASVPLPNYLNSPAYRQLEQWTQRMNLSPMPQRER